MHSLTICFGPAATIWTLLFKEETAAKAAYASAKGVSPLLFSVTDDFGQAIALDVREIKGLLLEDMDISVNALVERGLHQARAQAKAQVRAMADETIKSAARAQNQGPAVYTPGGMPNGPRGMM